MFTYITLLAASLPVIGLCMYIYKKDPHKEPKGLLTKIFIFGCLTVIPVGFIEVLVGGLFSTDDSSIGFVRMFINTLFGVALIEEGFKWLVTRLCGYRSKEFDEVYDIIVYSVFASLGFAFVENFLYVLGQVLEGGLGSGIFVAVIRGLLSVPGHACDGVIMGFFLSKAKVGLMNGNKGIVTRNTIFSLLIPTLFHSFYDSMLFIGAAPSIIAFFVFHIAELVICIIIVKKMSTIQQNITTNVDQGAIVADSQGNVSYNTAVINNNINNYCPICGRKADGANFCPSCGYKLK